MFIHVIAIMFVQFVSFIIDLQYILDVVEPADAASAPAEENK